MDFQWYPGHMAKARRQMQEDLKLIDLIIELADARIPNASRNPDIDSLANNKARLILLNKADLADPEKNRLWTEHYKKLGFETVCLDSRKKNAMKQVLASVMESCSAKLERDRKRGIKNRPIRAMVVGIPNVGKSTFINTFAGRAVAKTGNRPGVTKGKQWIRLNKNVELLDTPGILWPKFEDQTVGLHLALIGSMNDQILSVTDLALELIEMLRSLYPDAIAGYYPISADGTPVSILEEIAACRNCIKKGAEIDYEKAASLLLDDFRSGKLGQISLETPEQS
ncbi:MAG: ribosome biogenesis GTPase YlqF [Lachnospiraceae bacterium]|nr:ribosome biogenesis GTPase YlqF [Lachnospiraceae bacterium]